MSVVMAVMGMVMIVMVAATAAFAVLVLVFVVMGMRVIMLMLVAVFMPAAPGVIMRMAVVVRMIVVMMPATAARVIMVVMIVLVGGLKIGTAFGIKRGFNCADFAAKPLHHVLDHVIMADAQLAARDLHGEMAIAEVPCQTQRVLGVLRLDFGEAFGRTDDLDDAAVFQRDAVPRAQGDRLDQVEQEARPAHALHGDAAAMAIIEFEHDGIGGLAFPIPGGDHLGGA